jgi:hypothetical protein
VIAVRSSEEIVKREGTRIRFGNRDMDFLFNWLLGVGAIVGLSHGELFQAVDGMKMAMPSSGSSGSHDTAKHCAPAPAMPLAPPRGRTVWRPASAFALR